MKNAYEALYSIEIHLTFIPSAIKKESPFGFAALYGCQLNVKIDLNQKLHWDLTCLLLSI